MCISYYRVLALVLILAAMIPSMYSFKITTKFATLAQANAKLKSHRTFLPCLLQSSGYSAQASPAIVLTSNKPLSASVHIDKEIVNALTMNNQRGKAKLFVSNDGFTNQTIDGLRTKIESHFAELKNQPYKLRYKIIRNNIPARHNPAKLFDNDEDMNRVMRESYALNSTLQLYVQVNPGTFPLSSDRTEDPFDSPTYTMLSFYCFQSIADPAALVGQLMKLWKPLQVLGRVYVASEGVNAQMAVPTNILEHFQTITKQLSLFAEVKLNSDHIITKQEYRDTIPFRSLHIKVKDQIVADGLSSPLDWSDKGVELSPLEWHARLQAIDDNNSSDSVNNSKRPIVLDCRNNYESDVGKFTHAQPLNTSLFSESWSALDDMLQDTDKDTPIMAYCTGGIRCVKIGAYLQQKLGFTDVSALKGGIIAYTRELENLNKSQDNNTTSSDESVMPTHLSRHVPTSLFKGLNYVFDERLGARVTEDVLSNCETCGESCDSYINCQFPDCNIRLLQCINCRTSYGNCCSKSCQMKLEKLTTQREADLEQRTLQDLKNSRWLRRQQNELQRRNVTAHSVDVKLHAATVNAQLEAMGTYADRHTSQEPQHLKELREDTISTYGAVVSRMLSGPLQGRLLSMLVSITKAKTVLELGAFTGYSALCFAEALKEEGRVTSCEPDLQSRELAVKHIERSGLKDKIDLRDLKAEELIKEVRNEAKSFDLVFIDADKKSYKSYLQSLLGESDSKEAVASRCLLNPDALILVDNTLWKGLVLHKMEDLSQFAPGPEEYGDKKRMEKMTDWIHTFNDFVVKHPKLEVVLVPMRDGLTLIRYKG